MVFINGFKCNKGTYKICNLVLDGFKMKRKSQYNDLSGKMGTLIVYRENLC